MPPTRAKRLACLADATADEKRILGGMPYSVNRHHVPPRPGSAPAQRRRQRILELPASRLCARPDNVLVSYDLTRLQRLSPDDGGSYIVSLGESDLIEPTSGAERIVYEHPQYTPDSVAASSASPHSAITASRSRGLSGLGFP